MRTLVSIWLTVLMAGSALANPLMLAVAPPAAGGGGNNVTNPDNADAASLAASASPTIAFPGAVNAGSFLVLVIRNGADETTTVSSVTDSVNGGTWTLFDGPIDHPSSTLRSWCYYKENTGAGTPTVTINLSTSIAVYAAVAEFRGVPTSSVIDASATTATTASGTSHATNNVSATQAGAVISLLALNATGTVTPQTGETDVTAESTRAHILFETHAGAGTYSHSVTTSVTSPGVFFAFAIKSN